jgi:hypothetical protein
MSASVEGAKDLDSAVVLVTCAETGFGSHLVRQNFVFFFLPSGKVMPGQSIETGRVFINNSTVRRYVVLSYWERR